MEKFQPDMTQCYLLSAFMHHFRQLVDDHVDTLDRRSFELLYLTLNNRLKRHVRCKQAGSEIIECNQLICHTNMFSLLKEMQTTLMF